MQHQGNTRPIKRNLTSIEGHTRFSLKPLAKVFQKSFSSLKIRRKQKSLQFKMRPKKGVFVFESHVKNEKGFSKTLVAEQCLSLPLASKFTKFEHGEHLHKYSGLAKRKERARKSACRLLAWQVKPELLNIEQR